MMTIIFVLVASLILYWTLAMDYAVAKAARTVMTGYAQKNAMTQATFQSQALCPYLPGAMACADVTVNLQTVVEAAQPAGYYSYVNAAVTALLLPTLGSGGGTYSPGVQGSYEYLQVVYPVTIFPSYFAKILGSAAVYKGRPAYLIVATAVFRNEQY